ncbi:uncharacterized protein N7483_002478 [Penicillium malachiteum]|uniref:uncharacterized protein n=1 Tax=Penicillium malachiteum TaxID=1324776 RepID=UPI002546A5C5|nr:uncharacterized protein N7483_002478 [Penicillium malachiteum]KAJ5737353.1 hypothetical protein N7483_002478 [Penicillium malachiteum]
MTPYHWLWKNLEPGRSGLGAKLDYAKLGVAQQTAGPSSEAQSSSPSISFSWDESASLSKDRRRKVSADASKRHRGRIQQIDKLKHENDLLKQQRDYYRHWMNYYHRLLHMESVVAMQPRPATPGEWYTENFS